MDWFYQHMLDVALGCVLFLFALRVLFAVIERFKPKWPTGFGRAILSLCFVAFVVFKFPLFEAMVLIMLYWILENTARLGQLIESTHGLPRA